MDHLLTPESIVSFLTLSSLEIVLGLDNIIFISILASRLPKERREPARKLGLFGALGTRLLLLSLLSWITRLTTPLFTVFGQEFSGKSLVLFVGGLFLLFKSTREIHHKLEGEAAHGDDQPRIHASFGSVILQITLLDMVFSLDSVITAVGMTQHIPIMVAANVAALGVMLWLGGVVSDFVERHPTVKVLALSFLLMIGLVLVADGLNFHIPKAYVYFSMGFSIFVEFLNLKVGRKGTPVHLKQGPPAV